MQKCKELNIYINNNINASNKIKIDLKEEIANVTYFSLEGNNIFIDNSFVSKLVILK